MCQIGDLSISSTALIPNSSPNFPPVLVIICRHALLFLRILWRIRIGGCSEGVFSQWLSSPEVAIANGASNSSKNSLAITEFLAEKAQLANYCEKSLPEPPPHPTHPDPRLSDMITIAGFYQCCAPTRQHQWWLLGRKAPRAKFWRKISPTWATNPAKNWRIFRRFSSFIFQEKWAQERRKIGDFRPSFSRRSGRKKFHEKSSTNSTGHETKFFHHETLGVWGHKWL